MAIGRRKKRLGMRREGLSWYLDPLSSGIFRGPLGHVPFFGKKNFT